MRNDMDPANLATVRGIPTDELPPELQDLIEEMRANQLAKIETIGKDVAKKRDEAVKGRKQSGIETIWQEDEEYYQGVDDANRDSHPWVKSASTTGGISRTPQKSSTRCSSFFNITRQFVDSAAARMGDILLPSGDWNFAVKPTPLQDTPPEGVASDEYFKQQQAIATQKAGIAETQIHDWLTECQYHGEARKVIENSAKLGTGILKGPFPDKVTTRRTTTRGGQVGMEIITKTQPGSRSIDPWDGFPDPNCGDSIHNGSYFLERDRLTAKQLKNLKGLPGYLDDQIDKVIDEGPNKKNYSDGYRNAEDQTAEDDKFEVWYFYGMVDTVGLSAMSVEIEAKDSAKRELPAVVTLVNETPIKAFINPLDSGEFPYDFMPWQRTPGSPWGVGVARQGRTPQDMLNAGARRLMDNAGLSAAPQVIVRRNAISPADGVWELRGGKIWWASDNADVKSVADAFTAINIPMMQAELMAIIELAYKMMEDSTGIFFIMQGQQGSAPDTVGGMQLLHQNASTILRRIARVFDECITEPHIRRYYEWLLMHGPENAKGDLKIEAVGSTALVEREIQAMESMVLLQLSMNPAYGLDPEKAMVEVLKAKRFVPDKWTMDEQKKKSLPAPVVPAIEVAKIRDETERWKTKVMAQTGLRKMEVDTDRDTAYVEAMAQRDQTTASVRIQELNIKRELALLDYANKRNIALDQVKAELAKESMKLRVQKELTGITQVAEPLVEPPGRASDGHAFTE